MYTVEIHAERLKKMLNKKNPCNKCPAAKQFNSCRYPSAMWTEKSKYTSIETELIVCNICREFVGLKRMKDIKEFMRLEDEEYARYRNSDMRGGTNKVCPCFVLGKNKAIKKSYLALEAYENKKLR